MVFGALYGAAAQPLLGTIATLATSAFIFSGALQFAIVSLLSSGAAAPALVLTAGTLNLRHIVLGAVLRTRMSGSRARRAALAFVLLDETFGFAVAAANEGAQNVSSRNVRMERALTVSGAICYLAWQAGTLLGVVGAGLSGIERAAEAIFPVLFIGLGALVATTRRSLLSAIVAAALTALIAILVPAARSLAPVAAGLLVALPGKEK